MDHNLEVNRRTDLNTCACTPRVFVWIARALLMLTAISLITMPVTQHLWTWDRFLHGGRDFELSTLMILSFLGLALVLSKNLKQCFDSLFSALCILAFACHERVPIRITWAVSIFRTEYVAASDTDKYGTPLLI
ncbi:MAG: hypothetical protein WB561_20695 [Terracidiphilus sp.]